MEEKENVLKVKKEVPKKVLKPNNADKKVNATNVKQEVKANQRLAAALGVTHKSLSLQAAAASNVLRPPGWLAKKVRQEY